MSRGLGEFFSVVPAKNSLFLENALKKEERAALFRFISPLRVGRPFQGERREVQTPPLCEFRLPVEFGLAMNFRLRTLFPISRAASRNP